ncbi:MAG TPA: DUF58 domain-containing protein [Candidatus Acidoferrales bacterium]
MAVLSKEPAASSVESIQKLPVGRVSSSHSYSKNKDIEEGAEKSDAAGWRNFLIAMFALALAFGLAIYSGAAAQTGARWVAGITALAALALAGWVAVTIVPALARRSTLRWLTYRVSYRLTREGIVYLAGIFIVLLAALNTGNNLLFLVLGCMLAGIVLSGILSRITLAGVELHLELPEHVFAGEPAPAVVELTNLKRMFPSFALRVMGQKTAGKSRADKAKNSKTGDALLERPVYFPYLPRGQSVRNRVDLLFPKRGVYRQETLALRSRFPFGFLEKTRKLPARAEISVYPSIEPTETFYEILPLLSGELESYQRGRGHDLYAIREFVSTDGARFVDWKASAKSGSMKVKEFAREDERRVLIAFDPFVMVSDGASAERDPARAAETFERAVSFCACLAWHFRELESVIGFRTAGGEVSLGPAADNIYDVLQQLAAIQPRVPEPGHNFLNDLARETQVFKIVLTSQPRGSFPTALWNSAYIVFFDSL